MNARRRGGVWPWLLFAHAVIVAALTTLFLVLHRTTAPEEGANIGAGIVALPLLALGLPWSFPFFINPYRFDGLTERSWYVVALGPAVLNVVLHGAALVVARTRRNPADPDR
jgi:hypothetical protein